MPAATTGETAASNARKVVGGRVVIGVEAFRDRHEQRETLGRLLLEPTTRLITISGRRGMGKSSLAANVLDQLEHDRWPHTDERIPVRGIVHEGTRRRGINLERIFFDCAALLGGDREHDLHAVWRGQLTDQEKAEHLFDALGEGLYVILLDNFEDTLDADLRIADPPLAAFFDALFCARSVPRVVLTSQLPVRFPTAASRYIRRIHLDAGLPTEEAISLLRDFDPNGDATLRDAEVERLAEAARRLHGIPLAIEVLAGTLLERRQEGATLDGMLSTFVQQGDVVDQLTHGRYRDISADERLAVQTIALYGRPASTEAIAHVLRVFAPGCDPPQVLAGLARLHMVHLVEVDSGRRLWELHPLDADIAAQDLRDTNDELHRAVNRRIADFYADLGSERGTWTSADSVEPQIREFGHRLVAGDPDDAGLVLAGIWEFLVYQGSVTTVKSMCAQLAGRLTAPRLELDRQLAVGFAHLIGGPELEMVATMESLRDRTDLRELAAPWQAARLEFLLADLYRRIYRLDDAGASAQRAIALFRSTGETAWEFYAMLIMALGLASARDAAGAHALCDDMQKLADENDDLLGRARLLDSRQAAYLAEHAWAEALRTGHEAIARYAEAGMPEAVGYILNGQGLACLGLNRHHEATGWFRRGDADGVRAESPRVRGLCQLNLAWTYFVTGRHELAREAGRAAREQFVRQGGVEVGTADALLRAVAGVESGDRAGALAALDALLAVTERNIDVCSPSFVRAETARLHEELRPGSGAS